MVKNARLKLVTAAAALCALGLVSQMGAGDHRLPAQEWLLGLIASVVISTLLLWSRLRWAVALAIASYAVLGCFHAWLIFRVVQTGNYDGPEVLIFLTFIGVCPFAAALFTALWGPDYCRRPIQ